MCESFDEVIDAIATGEFEQEKVARFRAENFDRIDTHAADRVIDWLILGTPSTPTMSGGRPSQVGEQLDDAEDTVDHDISEEEIA